MATLEHIRQQLANFQPTHGDALVIIPPSRLNWLLGRNCAEVWFVGRWHELKVGYATGAGQDLVLLVVPTDQHDQLWKMALTASKLAPFEEDKRALTMFMPSGQSVAVSCNQEDALWNAEEAEAL